MGEREEFSFDALLDYLATDNKALFDLRMELVDAVLQVARAQANLQAYEHPGTQTRQILSDVGVSFKQG